MKKSFLLVFIVSFYSSYSQVGIRTNDPKATLDIQAVDPTHPTPNDGIIIPRVNSLMNPALMSADQNGMLVFLTPNKRFYYWSNDNADWMTIIDNSNTVRYINDLFDAKTNANNSSIFLGYRAGLNNTAYSNIALGSESQYRNTTGHSNVSIGTRALYSNTTGINNSAYGHMAMMSNTTGNRNTAIGYSTLESNKANGGSTAIGFWAMLNANDKDTDGIQTGNTAVGYWALRGSFTPSDNTGVKNTAIGSFTQSSTESGSENTSLGYNTLSFNSTGNKNTAIGGLSGFHSTGDSNVFIGYLAGYNETGSNTLYIENKDSNPNNALIYGEFGPDVSVVGNMLRTNAEFQIGSPDLNGYIFPIARGTNEQLLQTDGSGQLSWVASSSLGTDAQTLSYSGTILSISNGNTVTIPNGDITEVIAGDGLTGGGVSDDITINVEAINGITSTPDEIKLGGVLTENTSINQGDYHMLYNLNGNGDFSIEENGHSYFKINDNGDINADESTFVLDASANKIGINKTTPNSFLDISANSSGGTGHLELTETGSGDGARILFKNAVETDNKWTLYAKADNTNSDSYFNIHHTGTGNVLIVRGNGNVGIKRTPVTNDLEVNGTASKSSPGSWLGNSDRRLKTDIQTISEKEALQKLLKLRGVTYKWNDQKTGIDRPKGVQYGFIAQELMKVFPEKVTKDEEGYYQTAYADYDPLFVQAIKELNNQVELLKTLNKNILNENLELKKRLDKIESLINK